VGRASRQITVHRTEHPRRRGEAAATDRGLYSLRTHAYRCGNGTGARRLLTNLARRLRDDHPGAASSLEEGLDETLTVMDFVLPDWLERTLSTTSAIENLVGSVRGLSARGERLHS
jgi:hypothetical protein